MSQLFPTAPGRLPGHDAPPHTPVGRYSRLKTLKGVRKVSQLRKPDDMSLEEWQIVLRKEFSKEQTFHLKNIGPAPVFSEFSVSNPATGGTYKVTIRGAGLADNYCSCPDFSVNTLGTCKHVEFVLSKRSRKKGVKRLLREGFSPVISEIYLRYGGKREVIFRRAKEFPTSLNGLVRKYFDDSNTLRTDAFSEFETFLKSMQTAGHKVRCFDDVVDFIAEVRDRTTLCKRISAAFPNGISPLWNLWIVSVLDPPSDSWPNTRLWTLMEKWSVTAICLG